MAHLEFAPALQRHASVPPFALPVTSLHSLLSEAFERQPSLQSYVLDDQGCVRKHVAIFVNGRLLHDRKHLDVPLSADDRVYVAQALSGG
ncbi:MAG TPA: MoaD/ThiS family protein [Burkholderiaceae bacterium]|jgi:sulfur carrier protein ThiS|nr:MoaD/ThiS family protein [Burkholderiaceae bacterium]